MNPGVKKNLTLKIFLSMSLLLDIGFNILDCIFMVTFIDRFPHYQEWLLGLLIIPTCWMTICSLMIALQGTFLRRRMLKSKFTQFIFLRK